MWRILALSLALMLASLYVTAQPSTKAKLIPLNSYLFANSTNTWLSPSGDFAFGFYPSSPNDDDDTFLVGIWLDKISEKMLVWSANIGQPVGPKSSLHLTNKGNIIIDDPQGIKLPIGEPSETANFSSFGDDGNFAVYLLSSSVLWQTFDIPTDTILPTQSLKPWSQLTSSSGRFILELDGYGNLLLYQKGRKEVPIPGIYWEKETLLYRSSLLLDRRGLLFVAKSNESIQISENVKISIQNYYILAKIDRNGILRVIYFERNEREDGDIRSWKVAWSPISNACQVKGICGKNALCNLTIDGDFICKCPPGYKTIGRDDGEGYDCVLDKIEGEIYEEQMIQLNNTNWPLSSDYYGFHSMDAESCKNACWNDSFCAASVFAGSSCWLKGSPLLDGVTSKNTRNIAFLKMPVRVINQSHEEHDVPQKEERLLLIIAVTLLCLCLVFLPSSFAFMFFRFKKKETSQLDMTMRAYTYRELKAATWAFTEPIGKGSSATVYRGLLPDGRLIAVKKIEKVLLRGEREFKMELKSIGNAHHRNLVQMLGYCNQGTHRLLVYEYMSNGSLSGVLFGDLRPMWAQRMQIVKGIARGLLYLHEECRDQIIHCDIKPHNVLLDAAFSPKISDFGMAKLLGLDKTRTFTMMRGTRGYMAPEWFKNSPISTKIDVYSFGVMLLEIIFCQKGLGVEKPNVWSEKVSMCFVEGVVGKLLEEEGVHGNPIAMDRIREEMKRLASVGLQCVQEDPNIRPNMREVIFMLEAKEGGDFYVRS